MGKAKFSDDFKRDAVHQITQRGYPVAEVSRRLGVSTHSLYAWVKKFSKPPSGDGDGQWRRARHRKCGVRDSGWWPFELGQRPEVYRWGW